MFHVKHWCFNLKHYHNETLNVFIRTAPTIIAIINITKMIILRCKICFLRFWSLALCLFLVFCVFGVILFSILHLLYELIITTISRCVISFRHFSLSNARGVSDINNTYLSCEKLTFSSFHSRPIHNLSYNSYLP